MCNTRIVFRKWFSCLVLFLLLGCGSNTPTPVPDILALTDREVIGQLAGKPDKEGQFYMRASAMGLASLTPVGGPDESYLASPWFRESFSIGSEQYHVVFVRLQLMDAQTDTPLNDNNALAAMTYRKGDTGWWPVSDQHTPFTQIVLRENFMSVAEKRQALMLTSRHRALFMPVSDHVLQILAFDGQAWTDLGTLFTDNGNFEVLASDPDQFPDIRVHRSANDMGNRLAPDGSVLYRMVNGMYHTSL